MKHICIHVYDSAGTVVEKRANTAGTHFALVKHGDGTWSVYKRAENYSSQHKGGMQLTWRYVEKGLSEQSAKALFSKRIAGTQK